jgi:MOSC domain-containing protein YiiM
MTAETKFLRIEELEAGLNEICESPKDGGALRMIVRRPHTGARQTMEQGELTLTDGLVGDSWRTRGSSRRPDGSPDPENQLTIMNARAVALLAKEKERWELAGDQLFIDLDLSASNLPPGTRLLIGAAVIEVTAQPHTGCKKFQGRYGADAIKFVNSPTGRKLNLRGVNAKVIQGGAIRVGDLARKM